MELTVAISIILLVIITVISLTIINITAQKDIEQRIMALQFAREGIEVIRNLRDSSRWLQSNNNFLNDQSIHFVWAQFDPAWYGINSWFIPIANQPASIDDPAYILYRHFDMANNYTYYNHTAASGTNSQYRRQIEIGYICKTTTECGDGVCSTGEADCTSAVVGFKVTSRVKWQGRYSSQLELVDHLYLWR